MRLYVLKFTHKISGEFRASAKIFALKIRAF